MRLSKFGWILLLPIGIGAAIPYPAWSATFETGLDAVYAGDKDKALSIWKILAARGDARAQFRLARLYDLNSASNEKDLQRAVEWYQKAAEQSLASAQNRLGELTAEGRGVSKDAASAFRLWQAAAAQGNVQGQYNLGLAYFRGEGTSEDSKLAEKWLRSAADGGYAPAEFVLGQLRNEGLLLSQDQGRALAWFLRSSDNGHPEATAQVRALLATGVSPAPLPAPQSVNDTEETSGAKTELADAEAKISVLTEDLEAAGRERNSLQQSLDQVRDELATQNTDALAAASALEAQLAAMQQEVKTLDTETAAAREQTVLKSTELAEAQREITDLRAAMKSLEEGFETEAAADAKLRESALAEIAILKTQIAAGSAETARQSESFAAAQAEIAKLQSELTAARADVENTQTALTKAETEATELTSALSSRQSEIEARAEAHSVAQKEIETLKAEAADLSAKIKNQSDAMAVLEQQASLLTANASADKKKLTDGNEALASAETEIASLKALIAASAIEVANRDEAIAAGEQKIADLQASANANLVGKDATLAEAQAEAEKLRESLRSNEAAMVTQAEALATAQNRYTDLEEELTNVEDKLIAAEERSQTDVENLNYELIKTRQEVAQLIALKAGLEESLKTAEGSAKLVIDQLESDAAEALEQAARVDAAAKLWEQDAVAKTDEIAKLRAEMLEVGDQLAATEGLLSAKDRLLASLKTELTGKLTLARERIQELEATQTASVQEVEAQSDRADLAEQKVAELSAALTTAENALQTEGQAEAAATVVTEASPEALAVTPVAAVQKIEPARTATFAPAKISDANIKRGDAFLELGDIASARLFYELSMDSGNKRAATSIGKTFDPLYLQSLDVVGAPGRPAKAREWYEIGAGAGDDDAVARLKALRAWEQR